MRKYKTLERLRLVRAALDAIDAGFSLREISRVTGLPVMTLADAKKGRTRWIFEDLKTCR